MAIGSIHVAFDGDTGLPRDRYVNTFHVQTEDVTDNAAAIVVAIKRFYDTATAGGNALTDFLSAELAGTAQVKVYDLADSPPRVPVYAEPWSGLDVAGSALPAEVALVLSYQAVSLSGSPQARRRGRLYFGPLSDGASSGNPARPASALVTTLAQAAARLKAELEAVSDFTAWAVYSTVNNAAYAVDNGWVDNAFDTQRRRGAAATARTTWS